MGHRNHLVPEVQRSLHFQRGQWTLDARIDRELSCGALKAVRCDDSCWPRERRSKPVARSLEPLCACGHGLDGTGVDCFCPHRKFDWAVLLRVGASELGAVLPPSGHLAESGDIIDCYTGGGGMETREAAPQPIGPSTPRI